MYSSQQQLGLRWSFCRLLLTKSPLRSNGVCGMAYTCQLGIVALRLIFDVWIKERRLAFLLCLGDVFLSVEEFLYFLYPLACKLWCLIINGSESMSAEYTRQIGAGETLLWFVCCRKCFCELSLFCEPLIANSTREYRVPGMLDFRNYFQ